MDDLAACIARKWMHSFEDDRNDIRVYRPADYDFPRARGRAGIEFKPNGEFVEWAIAPTDAQQAVPGRWLAEGPTRLRVWFEQGARTPRTLEIVHCDNQTLQVRERPGSP